MQTQDLDNGSFWMLVEPTPSLRALSLAGLIVVACSPSLSVGLQTSSSPDLRQLQRGFKRSVNSILPTQPALGKLPSIRRLHSDFYSELWRKGSHARKIAHVWMKIVDLTLQLFMLYQTLEAGFPLALVVTCTLIVVWNAFAVVMLMYSPSPPSQIGEAFVDSMSDFLVAVGFPVLVLTYCLTTFEFDRASQRLLAELYPLWSFQNAARLHANPEQTARIFKSLEGLRFQSVGVCIARIGNNFALLTGLRRLIKLLRTQGPKSGYADIKVKSNVYPRKHPLGLVFVAFALATIIFVSGSIYRSRNACRDFPMCTIHAYRWWLSSTKDSASNNCPCRVLIDMDVSPANFSAWIDPPDATTEVSKLAASGDLEILQLVNRRLSDLPEPIRRCSHLKHIALIFTHTTTLPVWTSEFTDLEFLHIQGKARTTSLASLPQGLFRKMKKLTFLHLGAHMMLPKLPDVASLTNLRSITMAKLEVLETLPADFAQLTRLEIMLVLAMPRFKTFPDLARARQTLKMLVIDNCPLCCNGFLQNECDLSSSICGQKSRPNEALACVSPGLTATTGTLELFKTFNSTVCVNQPGPPSSTDQIKPDSVPPDHGNPTPPPMPSDTEIDAAFERSIQQCNGILYRECKPEPPPGAPNSSSGICFSDRFMPISCSGDHSTIELRRQQIMKHIGPICNPKYEAWLGCIN
ncbi:hypothetical protein PC116_g15431 [Phytophthora cactorum]|nr:hypothetical protein PC116_g15431 [Phytophthora cactorum]